MSKILTFSRQFPAYHPKAGQPTHFVEAILNQLFIGYKHSDYLYWLVENNPTISRSFLVKFWLSLIPDIPPKSHTIRAHKKPLKVGEFINPKCWAGKPYHKTEDGYWQIKFAPDIEVKKVWDFEIKDRIIYVGEWSLDGEAIKPLAKNDGLSKEDLLSWFHFPNPFKGQIICWNEKINY